MILHRENPLVSILIPVKNGMPFIQQSIESVLNSKYKNIELIVSDDHSTDGSRHYINSLDCRFLKFIETPRKLSIGEHWNFLSEYATGKYVKLLCSDDTLLPKGISNQVAALELNPDVGMVSSRRQYLDSNGKKLFLSRKIKMKKTTSGKMAVRKSFFSGTNIFGEPSSVMFRKENYMRNLPWDDSDPYLLDFEFYVRLLIEKESKVMFLTSIDGSFRIHGSSLSSRTKLSEMQSFTQISHKYSNHLKFTFKHLIIIAMKNSLKSQMRRLIYLYYNKTNRNLSQT